MSNINVIKSTCGMCHGGCGVLISIKDGKIIKIEGDPESPLNKGALCPKGQASLEHLYNEKRLKFPLQRVGGKGEGKWKEISWETALDLLAFKLKEIKNKYGAHTVAFLFGTMRHHNLLVGEFAKEYGSPNWAEHLQVCFLPHQVAEELTYGNVTFCDLFSEIKPKIIISWGANPVVSGLNPNPSFPFLDAINSGSKVITIDPRKSETAKISDMWLQIRPGTDCALALALINVIINENLYDVVFVEKYCIGFKELKEHVQKYTPEWAEKIIWISAEEIRKIAKMYALNKPACIRFGVSLEQNINSVQTCRAISTLIAITGNLDIEGGNVIPSLPVQRAVSFPSKIKMPPINNYPYLPGAHFPSIIEAIKTEKPYPIKSMFIFGANPLVSYPNPKEIYNAFLNIDFIVVSDIYMTPTAELADIILPAATWLEVDSLLVPIGNTIFCHRKIVEIENTKTDEWILQQLAKKIGMPLGHIELESIYDAQLAPAGITFQELKDKGQITFPTRYKKYECRGLNTFTKKIELYSKRLELEGFEPMPTYIEPPESPISTPEVFKEYPLILITGRRSINYFHSAGRQINSLRKTHKDPLIEIHPTTADKYGLKEDDWVWIETTRGRIKQKAKIIEDIHPDVISIEHGWYFPEIKDIGQGFWISNANILIDSKPRNPMLGSYQLRGLLCKIYKV